MAAVRISNSRVRNLSVEELGLELPPASELGSDAAAGLRGAPASSVEPVPMPASDLLDRVRELLEVYGGVILSGPPGTSKSYYAARLALAIGGSSERVRFVQF